MPAVADYAHMPTEAIAERLRTVQGGARLAAAHRLLAEARRSERDTGMTPVGALARACGNYAVAQTVMEAGRRVARSQKRAPRAVMARLLVLLIAP